MPCRAVGVYAGFCNHFNIGAFMEKGLRMGAGQTPCQAYWKDLLQHIQVRAGYGSALQFRVQLYGLRCNQKAHSTY